MTKQGIIKSIRTGKISGTKDAHGQWLVEPAELLRVYTKVGPVDANQSKQVDDSSSNDANSLQAEIKSLREKLSVLEVERGREREQLSSQIEDLRKRLDDESTERRQLSALLTHQQAEQKGRGLWKRLFG